MAFRVTPSAGRAPHGAVRVKICGLREAAHVRAAAEGGAAYVGFVFFPPSPRAVTIDRARALAVEAPVGLAKVGLFVDPDDATLDAVNADVPLDMIQLHGRESAGRVAAVRARTGLPVMKAVGIATRDDLAIAAEMAEVADQILLDAKPPKDATRPGGNGVSFDWGLLAALNLPVPWMLSGGLHAGNVAEAIARTGARQIDLSSGVETAPGVKDEALIRALLAAVAPRVSA